MVLAQARTALPHERVPSFSRSGSRDNIQEKEDPLFIMKYNAPNQARIYAWTL